MPQSISSPTAASPNLPRAHVLSYIASADSPTRVRKIAARALGVLAALHAVAALVSLSVFSWDIVKSFREYRELASDPAAGRWLPPLHDWLWDASVNDLGLIMVFVDGVTLAAVLFACARPVGRGKRFACFVAIAAMILPMLQLLFTSAGCGGAAVIEGLGIGAPNPERLSIWFFLPAIILGLFFLLLWDLAGYLRWIGKNPITEISPKSFLPVRAVSPESSESTTSRNV